MTLPIIFEDEDLVVINKPWGITVNSSDTTGDQETLQDLVSSKVDLKNSDDPEFTSRGGIVHRLDRETSGIILVAKNSKAFRALQAQFKERKVKKEYIALSHGDIIPEEGEISVPVGRLPWDRKKFGVLAGGRESKTDYSVIEKKKYGKEVLTLVRMKPTTGRTHQIRVHLKYLNHPIFSDFLYGGRKVSRADRKILPRVFLHASNISFIHPTTGKPLEFESELPKELREVLKVLEFRYRG